LVTIAIDTEDDQENIKALYTSLRTTSAQIDLSARQLALLHVLWHGSDSLFMQALVKHSQDKDQFLKATIKRMTETQILEDLLKEVGDLNLVLLAEKQELEDKLAEESQAKDGNHFTDSLFS
jgi:hypothetical protein